MKKITFITGALGGALTALLASDRTLRRKLGNAKDPKEAANVLGQALGKRGKELGEDVKGWLESPSVQRKLREGKDWLSDALHSVEKSALNAASSLKRKAMKSVPNVMKKSSCCSKESCSKKSTGKKPKKSF